jgi:hypothetical protein
MKMQLKHLSGDSNCVLDTDSAIRPGDFPLGSVESRAAARAVLNKQEQKRYACRKCLIAGLPPLHAPENPDAHWDSNLGVYKDLHHSPAEHDALGIVMDKFLLSVRSRRAVTDTYTFTPAELERERAVARELTEYQEPALPEHAETNEVK